MRRSVWKIEPWIFWPYYPLIGGELEKQTFREKVSSIYLENILGTR